MVEPLDVHVRMLLNGWVDVTGDVRADPSNPGGIQIRSGTSVEGTTPEPGSCTILLNNCDGRYSPRNPESPHYGFLTRNTPLQVYIDFPGPEVRSSSSGTSGDVESFTVNAPAGVEFGDVLVAFQSFATVPTDDLVKAPAGGSMWKFIREGGQANGDLRTAVWWKVALDNEPSSYTFYNPDGGESVVGIVAIETAVMDVPDIFAMTNSAETGAVTAVESDGVFPAGLADLELRWAMGIPAGAGVTWATPVELTELEDVNDGDAVTGVLAYRQLSGESFTDELTFTASGNVDNASAVTIAIPSRSYQFYGEVSEWPPRGNCADGNVWVPVTASGVLRRLNQDGGALSSIRQAYRTIIKAQPGRIYGYWPLEDGSDAIAPASELIGHPSLTTSGPIQFAASSRFPGSAPVLIIEDGGLSGLLPGVTDDGFSVSVLMAFTDTEPDNGSALVSVNTTGSAATVRIVYSTGFILEAEVLDEAGISLGTTGTFDFSEYMGLNERFLVRLLAQQSGADINFALNVTNIGADYSTNGAGASDTVNSETLGIATRVNIGPGITNTIVGHLGVTTFIGEVITDASDEIIGFFGEFATDRLRRLLSGTGLTFIADFGPDQGIQIPVQTEGTTVMGEEGVSARMTKIREVLETDRGILYEDRERAQLNYRTLDSLYNQSETAPLSYNDLAAPLEPIDDDLLTANDITVTQRSGSSVNISKDSGVLSTGTSRPGVGVYSQSASVNVASELDLPHIANWMLHIGTWDEYRFDRIEATNLAILRCPSNPVLTRFVLALDPGDVINLSDLPEWIAPNDIRVMVRGRDVVMDKYQLHVAANAVPADPYTVGVFSGEGDTPEEDAPARYSSQGSETASGLLLTGNSGDYASAPDAAPLRITGDIDIRARIRPVAWDGGGSSQIIVARADGGTDNSYIFGLNSSGELTLTWSDDGTNLISETSSVAVDNFDGPDGSLTVRATLDVDNGSGGYTVTFYYGEDVLLGPWTELGTAQVGGSTTSIFAGTSDIEVGTLGGGTSAPFEGIIYQVIVMDGIGTFNSPATPNFSSETTSPFTDGAGNVWTVHGNASLFPAFQSGTDTSLFVRTLLGPLWTTSQGGDFDIRVDGARLRVTAIGSATANVQEFTVQQTPINGVEREIDPGEAVELWTPAVYAR